MSALLLPPPRSGEADPTGEARPLRCGEQRERRDEQRDGDGAHARRISAAEPLLRDLGSMNKHRLALLVLVVIAAGCGSGSQPSPTVPEPTTTALTKTMPLTVFRVVNGALRAEAVKVPETRAVAAAALAALGVEARVTIDEGTAHVDLADASAEQVAEIVYTLTQFASV